MKLKPIRLTSKSKAMVDRTNRYVVKGTFAYPLVIKSGKGVFIQDIDNNWYLDFNSNVCSANIGYNHPEIVKVLKECSSLGAHKIAGQDFYCEEQLHLAEKLLRIVPGKLRKVFLVNSGTEAVENAIKFAFRKKGPLPGVACIGAFHGRTLGALSFTDSKAVQKKNYPEINHELIKFCTDDKDPSINGLEELIKRESPPAFMMLECIQGEGGYNIASKRFIRNLRKTCDAYDIPLIIDEVQSGVGRTGKWWSFEHYGVEPDIMACAKSLQVGATLSSDKYAPGERGSVSSTWGGGDRIDMAVGLKTIEVIEKEKLLSKADKMGKYLLARLKELEDKHPRKVFNARGLGLMLAIDFPSTEIRDKVEIEAFKRGLLLLGCGFKSIRLAPPMIIDEKEVDQGVEILDEVIKKVR